MSWILTNWTNLLDVIAYLIAISSIIVKITPTNADNIILDKIITALKVFSLYKK